MKISLLFVSALCSEKIFEFIRRTSNDKSGQAIQKFQTLLTEGTVKQLKSEIKVLSSLPVSPNINKKKIWNFEPDQNNGVPINYIPTLNLPFLKRALDFQYSFFYVFLWKLFHNDAKKVVVVDALKLSPSLGAFIACKIRRVKFVSIVTDMPGIDVFEESITKRIKASLIKFFLTRSDGYILITEQMNDIVNPHKKPFMVMEGLVDINMTNNFIRKKTKKERIILYSGGIYERYGVKNLLEGFMTLNDSDARLHIYGAGPLEEKMSDFMKRDSRIKYFGVVSNQVLVKKQMEATLLINPRPTFEDFTKYSFPSKNMEYMVSGTPTVTTLLPGMPKDYLPYIFPITEESSKGISIVLSNLLEKSTEELVVFGERAKRFVLEEKNNIRQGKRIMDFIETV